MKEENTVSCLYSSAVFWCWCFETGDSIVINNTLSREFRQCTDIFTNTFLFGKLCYCIRLDIEDVCSVI